MLGETAGGYGMVLPCEMELTWEVRRTSDGALMDCGSGSGSAVDPHYFWKLNPDPH